MCTYFRNVESHQVYPFGAEQKKGGGKKGGGKDVDTGSGPEQMKGAGKKGAGKKGSGKDAKTTPGAEQKKGGKKGSGSDGDTESGAECRWTSMSLVALVLMELWWNIQA